jgi:hypothetical protein
MTTPTLAGFASLAAPKGAQFALGNGPSRERN